MSHYRFMRRAAKGLLFSSIAFSASSYASSYYNCANATGCVAVPPSTPPQILQNQIPYRTCSRAWWLEQNVWFGRLF